MAKKILVFVVIIMLSLIGNNTIVLASNSSIGQLDNQGETESTAGITWDQISEMSQNSPNSLSPIQGLVLWMFAILAFLKLAQKMDSLLQSLGLNVTQTGGRAVGDLIMAGMAIKHVGSAFSKGMGMFGFGKGGSSGGGASGAGGSSGSGTGGKSAGGGPAPIPTGSPKSGGGSPGSHTTPGKTPTGSTATSSSTHGKSGGASPSSTSPTSGSTLPSSTSPTSGSTPPGSTSPTSGTSGSGSRNPVGRFAGWMKNDGFAQGVIKAGAKGGVIGVSAYSAKAGASKIGSAVSARFGGSDNISANPSETEADKKNNNPENYQTAKPLDSSTDQSLIPSSFNNEEYQDSKPIDNTDDSSVNFSSINNDEYNDAAPYDKVIGGQPIPVSMENETGGSSASSNSTTSIASSDVDNDEWNNATPASDSTVQASIPTTINDEAWKDSNPISQSPATAVTSTATGSTAPPSQPVQPVSSAVRDATVIDTGTVTSNETIPVSSQASTVVSNGATPVSSQAKHDAPSSISSSSNPPIGSSKIVSTADEASSSHDVGTVRDIPQSNPSNGSSATSFDPAPMPTHNQAVPPALPQGVVQSQGSTHDIVSNENAGTETTVPNPIQHAPIQSSVNEISTDNSINSSIPQSDVVHSSQTHVVPETIHTEPPSAAHAHGAETTLTSNSAFAQPNTIAQSQTIEVHSYTKPDTSENVHPTTQPTAPVVHVENQGYNTQRPPQPSAVNNDTSSRPAEKGKPRTSAKGRKRKR